MTQRVWFITGVSSGFGRLMAEKLLAKGDRVAGTVRRPETVTDLTAQYGDLFWPASLDVTETSQIRTVVNDAASQLGRLDVVVNNAGYGLFGAAEELSDAQILHQLQTNLIGSMQVIRAALPHLRAQRSGRIIQMSTYGGQVAAPGGSLYHAGKWGIEGFVEAVAQEVAVFGIGTTIVEPGGARTEFRYGNSQLGERLPAYDASPAQFARQMLEARSAVPIGDPAKMVDIIIASVDQQPAPLRLTLGSDAYNAMHKALAGRLAALEAQRDLALSTDG